MNRRLVADTLGVLQAAALFMLGGVLGIYGGLTAAGAELVPGAVWFPVGHAALWLSLWLAREVVNAPLLVSDGDRDVA